MINTIIRIIIDIILISLIFIRVDWSVGALAILVIINSEAINILIKKII